MDLVGFTWIFIAFLAGSLPFSVWLGRWALGVDIRHYGDGNPGAANVRRAGGLGWGVPAMLLDYLKGALPVSWIHFGLGFDGWALAAAAVAPVLGHAFSPFLCFHGGKALAVTFGVWTGLTLWQVPLTLGLLFGLWLLLLSVAGWAVLLGMASLFVCLLVMQADVSLQVVWLGNTVVLAWKHRADLARMPGLR